MGEKTNMDCQTIHDQYREDVEVVVKTQKLENREAIFFIYEDGSTSQIYKGDATSISLSPDQEAHISSQGNIVGSVHSHPSKFDPSTIDVMTGLMTTQRAMCVAAPIFEEDVEGDFVLTCLNLENLGEVNRRRMIRSMRRSSVSITELGRQLRKQVNMQRFNISECRSHELEVNGIEIPVSSRPSKFKFNIDSGKEVKKSRLKD